MRPTSCRASAWFEFGMVARETAMAGRAFVRADVFSLIVLRVNRVVPNDQDTHTGNDQRAAQNGQ